MTTPPQVSIISANFNGARYLPAAIRSVHAQTLTSFEWIVADDGSSDESLRLLTEAAAADPRIRVLAGDRNGGPAHARNRALDVARGRWIAVFDTDDLMASDRLERLVAHALAEDADLIVDNLMLFDDEDHTWRRFLAGRAYNVPRWISLAAYIDSSRMYSRRPGLGYLKPVIRAEALRGVRYREDLRIGEDYDLVVRLLAAGARLRFEPGALYRYRRHGQSISAAMSAAHVQAMLETDAAIAPALGAHPTEVRVAQARRRRSLQRALAYDQVIADLKSGRLLSGLTHGLARPDIWPLLTLPIQARAQRLLARLRMSLAQPSHVGS